jgi:hypothetical protein
MTSTAAARNVAVNVVPTFTELFRTRSLYAPE